MKKIRSPGKTCWDYCEEKNMNNEIIDELEDKLKKSLSALKKDFSKLRTGVASVSLLEDIKVVYYNQPTPLNQVATIAVPDSRTITIQPWDSSVVGEIEKAIQKSISGLIRYQMARLSALHFLN